MKLEDIKIKKWSASEIKNICDKIGAVNKEELIELTNLFNHEDNNIQETKLYIKKGVDYCRMLEEVNYKYKDIRINDISLYKYSNISDCVIEILVGDKIITYSYYSNEISDTEIELYPTEYEELKYKINNTIELMNLCLTRKSA